MAFTLLDNNLSGISRIDKPAGVIAGPDNFVDLYTYEDKEVPDLTPQLYMANGKGSITGLMRLLGQERSYASDYGQHGEEGQLMTVAEDVAVTGTTFVSPTITNVYPNYTVLISDGVTETQATVLTVNADNKTFTASNDEGGAFNFVGDVTVMCDFSNSYAEGSPDAQNPDEYEPVIYKWHTHVLKKSYKASGSKLVEQVWLQTPSGPRWTDHEVERTGTKFDNLVEYTNVFHKRKASGNNKGLNGIIPTIEQRGNIGNEYLTSIEDLSRIAYRAKQEGTCREFTVFHDHQQGAEIRQMLAGVNAHYAAGGNYGMFQNSKEMALQLGFVSCYIDGVQFHFQPWSLLDSATGMGSEMFKQTSVACLIIPTGETYAMENGNHMNKPYIQMLYREDTSYSRRREIKIFGPGGTQHKEDTRTTHMQSEFSNQLVGANNFFAVRSKAGFYS